MRQRDLSSKVSSFQDATLEGIKEKARYLRLKDASEL
jgi:hypothetical protein